MLRLERQHLIDYSDPKVCETIQKFKKREILRGEVVGIRKGGEKFPIRVTIADVEDEDGTPLTTVMAGDISAEKSQENTLRSLLAESQLLHLQEEDSRKMLLNVLDSITDGFFIVDNNWVVQYWNAAAERIMKKNVSELIGKNIWDCFPNLDFLRSHPDFQTITTEKKSVRFRDYFEDYNIWAEVSIYPSEKSISVYFKDVSEVSRLSMLENLEREVLKMNARTDASVENVLDFYLSKVEELHKGIICSVVRVKNNRLYSWSGPSLSQHFHDRINGIEVADYTGSCGTAAYRREKIVVENIETDPLWADYRDLAESEGVKACWSLPISIQKTR